MRRSGFLIRSIVIALVAGAGAVALAASGGDTGGAPVSAVEEWPNWTGRVSCGTPFNPLVAFARPANAEYGSLPSEVALRQYLAKTRHYFTHSPAHPWRLLIETSHYAEFGRGDLSDGGIEVNRFERGPKGWEWSGSSGSCQPALVRNHREAITWTLARGQELAPSTRTIKVDLGPGECDGGGGQNKRLERPLFREENGALLMALWLRPPPPLPPRVAYTCPALIEPPVKIHLPKPLGELALLDGGVFPPMSSAEQLRRDEFG